MNGFNAEEFHILFKNLCCSQCRNDFDFEDLFIMEEHKDLLYGHLKCHKCGKDFGDILLNYNDFGITHSPLEIID